MHRTLRLVARLATTTLLAAALIAVPAVVLHVAGVPFPGLTQLRSAWTTQRIDEDLEETWRELPCEFAKLGLVSRRRHQHQEALLSEQRGEPRLPVGQVRVSRRLARLRQRPPRALADAANG